MFEHENLPRKETLSSITQKTANDVVFENDPEISSAYLFSNKNTKYETFYKTNDNIEPLDTLKIYKQPLNLENNIPEEICLWGNNEKTLKSFIDKYISDNIPTFYNTNDLRKVRNIEEAFKIFDKNKNALKTNFLLFEHLNKETIVCELNTVCSALDKCPEFTKNTLDVFLMKFDLKIFYSLYFKDLRKKLARLSDEKSILVFYCEIFKLYKYAVDIPELLTLSGLFSKRSFPNVTLVIHLINLFFERNKNAKDKKVFIICMISKVLFCFYGYSFDIFLVSHYKFKCLESCHDLNYFIWEFNKHKRKDSKIRMFRSSEYISSERKYFKSVLLIYLYNFLLCCRYCNIGSESIEFVQEFIEKVMKSEGCIGCLLNEFLRVIQLCCNEKI